MLSIPQELLNCIEYNESSPSSLSWNECHPISTKRNKNAGRKRKDGYWVIHFGGKMYLAHRIVCVIFGNCIENLSVDHLDGNPSNNKISNLRVVSHKVNTQNKKKANNNKSGITGVYWTENNSGTLFAVATWILPNKKRRNKWFSTLKYGKELAFKLACEYREKVIRQLILNGENYSNNHGKRL